MAPYQPSKGVRGCRRPTPTFKKQFVPLAEAKIGVMTHAFNYGTGCFEGIRGNWNEQQERVYLFRLRDHFLRLAQELSHPQDRPPVHADELCDIATKLVGMSGYTEDIYLRPMVYKSSEVVGVRMHNLDDDLLIFVTPFGPYLDLDKGIRCMTSSWRRVDEPSIPARAKVTGIYVNTGAGQDGGAGERLRRGDHARQRRPRLRRLRREHLHRRDGELITPSHSDNILVGITRDTVIRLAREELGIETVERPIDRAELYTADECFMTGTAAHVTAVVDVDRRPVGNGQTGAGHGAAAEALPRRHLLLRTASTPDWCTPA